MPANDQPLRDVRRRTPFVARCSPAAKGLSKRLVVRVGGGMHRLFGQTAGSGTGILMYHRVTARIPGIAAPTWNVAPEDFRRQIRGLLESGYKPWPLGRLLDCHDQGEPPPARTFVVTFDDGHESVFRFAWPILRELDVPATIFLATAYLDTPDPFPFDDWAHAGAASVPAHSWRPLSSAQCEQMAAETLIELGVHTHTHRDFDGQPDAFEQDLDVSVELLRERFGIAAPSFSFPLGLANRALIEAARRTRVRCGLTTVAAPIDTHSDPFTWGRFDVESWDTAATLATKLSGWYSWAPRLRSRWTARRRPDLISGAAGR